MSPESGVRAMNKSERLLFRALQGLGVPVVPQARIGDYTVDFLLPEYKVIIEADSRLYHEHRDYASHDRARDLELQRVGYLTIHVWSDDLRDPWGAEKAIKHVVVRMFEARGIELPRFRKLYNRYR